MNRRSRQFAVGLAVSVFAAVALSGCSMVFAQSSNEKDSGLDLSLHAKSNADAATVGLPGYPGAIPYKPPHDKGDKENDSSLDLGFVFGDIHFSVIVVSYETSDSPARVLGFYRKPLSRYGEVLECDHGNPVGKLTMTNTGLTCENNHGGHVQVNGSGNSSNNLELRAGTPHKYRIVGIDDSTNGKTRFGLVYLELPKDKSGQPE